MTDRVERQNKFLRHSAYVAIWIGALQLIVRVLGDVFIWMLQVWDARDPTVEQAIVYPDMPWGFWTSVAGFAVLSLIGAAFWRNQIGEPGRVLDIILGWLPGYKPSSSEQ